MILWWFRVFFTCWHLRAKYFLHVRAPSFPHVRAPASRSPLRKTIQEVAAPGKGIFQPNKNLHRRHLLSQWNTEGFKNRKTATLKLPKSKHPWSKARISLPNKHCNVAFFFFKAHKTKLCYFHLFSLNQKSSAQISSKQLFHYLQKLQHLLASHSG